MTIKNEKLSFRSQRSQNLDIRNDDTQELKFLNSVNPMHIQLTPLYTAYVLQLYLLKIKPTNLLSLHSSIISLEHTLASFSESVLLSEQISSFLTKINKL